jgi:predicted nucleotide-binding protein
LASDFAVTYAFDPRDPHAFEFVRAHLKELAAERGQANALISREELVGAGEAAGLAAHDIEVAVTFLVLSETVREIGAQIAPTPRNDQIAMPLRQVEQRLQYIQGRPGFAPRARPLFEECYQIVERVLHGRQQDRPPARSTQTDRGNMTTTRNEPDRKKVFVIHGRHMAARKQMGIFLRALGLEAINFDDLRASLGGTPTVADIVARGMEEAYGVVAMITPDEYATLRPDLCNKGESGEMVERWQARPNVMFEAGMAFMKDRNRVVFVKFGKVSLFSDVAGIHILSPTNDVTRDRRVLRKTLKSMGCDVNDLDEWHEAGDFDAVIGGLPEVSTRSPFLQ